MPEPLSVKVSSRYQISVPSRAREELDIQSGDRLLVDVQDGMIILIPEPKDYAAQLAGLHHEIWEHVDTDAYLDEERQAWGDSESG
jgi:AbrB family looped-hinge helix DNA binding protein